MAQGRTDRRSEIEHPAKLPIIIMMGRARRNQTIALVGAFSLSNQAAVIIEGTTSSCPPSNMKAGQSNRFGFAKEAAASCGSTIFTL